MVEINGTRIRMTRGDTLRVVLSLTVVEEVSEGEKIEYPYVPEEGDRIRFAMKKTYDDSEPILVKDISPDTLLLTLNPEDTKDLDMRGRYVYDIELTHANGDVDTFINKAKLVLTEEVH